MIIQMHGFTCGIDDLLLRKNKDLKRKKQLNDCERCGEEVHREVVGATKSDILGILFYTLCHSEFTFADG